MSTSTSGMHSLIPLVKRVLENSQGFQVFTMNLKCSLHSKCSELTCFFELHAEVSYHYSKCYKNIGWVEYVVGANSSY